MKVGESKVSQRGSVVIPKAVREMLNVADGEKIEWHVIPRRESEINITVVKKREEGR